MTEIKKILEERGNRYGRFEDHAFISQSLQQVLWDTPNWDGLPVDVRQALISVVDKMSRILNGDPNYLDSYVDICGYITLIINRISEEENNKFKLSTESLFDKVLEKDNKVDVSQ